MKYWNTLPQMRHESDARCISDAVYDFFKVRPEVVKKKIRIRSSARRTAPSRRVDVHELVLPPMGETVREMIEGFIVAYARGFTDALLLRPAQAG